MHFFLKNLNDSKRLAKIISSILKPEIYLLLSGNLAVGKTTLAKYIIQNLGIDQNITSPTFVIMNQYHNNKLNINHMDCYRLNNEENFELYLDEFIDCVNIIE